MRFLIYKKDMSKLPIHIKAKNRKEAEEFAKKLNGDCHIMEDFHYYDDDDYDEDEFYFPDCGDWEDEEDEEDVPQEDNKSSLDEELDYWVKELESMAGGV